ncbi:MAG: hypothetical protein ACOC80_09870 [Petrotogales bacterium]
MINLYVAKKWVLMFLIGVIPSVMLIVFALSGFDILTSMLIVMLIALIMIFIANKMLRHSLTDLIEGKGMLTITLDSTGFIDTFIVHVKNQPFLQGIYQRKIKETMFDRDMAQYLIPPQKGRLVDAVMLDANGQPAGTRKVLLMPTQEEKADYLFSFGSFPTFVFNKVLDTFMQKSVLSNFEQDTFVKHAVMYLLKKTEDLSASVRDFARYVVEQTRPKKSWLEGKRWIIYLILAAAIVILIIMFAPGLIQAMEGAAGGLTGGGGAIRT